MKLSSAISCFFRLFMFCIFSQVLCTALIWGWLINYSMMQKFSIFFLPLLKESRFYEPTNRQYSLQFEVVKKNKIGKLNNPNNITQWNSHGQILQIYILSISNKNTHTLFVMLSDNIRHFGHVSNWISHKLQRSLVKTQRRDDQTEVAIYSSVSNVNFSGQSRERQQLEMWERARENIMQMSFTFTNTQWFRGKYKTTRYMIS